MNSTLLSMISYAFVLVAGGVAAYFHLLPVDLFVATFYLVAGHAAGANLPALSSSSSGATTAPAVSSEPAAPVVPTGGGNAVIS